MQVINGCASNHLQGYDTLLIGEGTWETVIKNMHSREGVFFEVRT